MPTRKADSRWEGNLKDGSGTMIVHTDVQSDVPFSFSSRFEEGDGTSPEELIAAAHAGCYSMSLSHELGQAGYEPESVRTVATVHLANAGNGFEISRIELNALVNVSGLNESEVRAHAEKANRNCPVSKALSGTEIVLTAHLVN